MVACKGDLKYLAQSLNLTRFPGCEEARSALCCSVLYQHVSALAGLLPVPGVDGPSRPEFGVHGPVGGRCVAHAACARSLV